MSGTKKAQNKLAIAIDKQN